MAMHDGNLVICASASRLVWPFHLAYISMPIFMLMRL
jgi:hypothetical protein